MYFDTLKGTLRHFGLIPPGGGGMLAHILAHIASSIKMRESNLSGDGIESIITRVERFLADGKLAEAADALENGVFGTEAEGAVGEWVRRARNRAITEQALILLQAVDEPYYPPVQVVGISHSGAVLFVSLLDKREGRESSSQGIHAQLRLRGDLYHGGKQLDGGQSSLFRPNRLANCSFLVKEPPLGGDHDRGDPCAATLCGLLLSLQHASRLVKRLTSGTALRRWRGFRRDKEELGRAYPLELENLVEFLLEDWDANSTRKLLRLQAPTYSYLSNKRKMASQRVPSGIHHWEPQRHPRLQPGGISCIHV
ncbi:hypothetical protein Taro_016728 [Colocasia esculenta]|uniref:Uncharacterized protein n=1 Tax=Colocasia esculenta TaxID=4460 RepID=A0A843UR58_COLES|nr:hypothetical protein [Colocasia esculenta]